MNREKTGHAALAGGGIAALLASACCVAPLALVSVGLGGAWLANLRVLEPYQPVFIGVALLALYGAHRRLFVRARACAPDDACARAAPRRLARAIFWSAAALVLVALVFPYLAPLLY